MVIGVWNKVNFQLVFSSCIYLLLNFFFWNAFYLSATHRPIVKDVGEMALLSFDRERKVYFTKIRQLTSSRSKL